MDLVILAMYENEIVHFPRLDTILLVEEAIRKSEKELTRTGLYHVLKGRVMYSTLKLILSYLEKSNKIIFSKNKVVWIFTNEKLNKAVSKGRNYWMNYSVRGVAEFDLEYAALKKSAEDGNGASQILLKKLDKAIEKLKYNYKAGEHISKNKIPAFYVVKYGVENLWKLNLDQDYRLIYTIRGTELEVMSVLLEYFDHKTYNKRFGYKS